MQVLERAADCAKAAGETDNFMLVRRGITVDDGPEVFFVVCVEQLFVEFLIQSSPSSGLLSKRLHLSAAFGCLSSFNSPTFSTGLSLDICKFRYQPEYFCCLLYALFSMLVGEKYYFLT